MAHMMISPEAPGSPPKAKYFSNVTVADLQPLDQFADWEEADEFLGGMQGEDTARRWVIGMAAAKLPTERGEHTFNSWCLRNGFEPDRVGVWRRCADLYDLELEVKRFPRLPIKHFEVLMGRMSKAKKKAADKGDYGDYKKLIKYLSEAHDGELSSREMMRTVLIDEGKITGTEEEDGVPQPLTIENCQFAVLDVNIAGPNEPPEWRMCPVLIPTSDAAGEEIRARATKRNILNEIVTGRLQIVTTE